MRPESYARRFACGCPGVVATIGPMGASDAPVSRDADIVVIGLGSAGIAAARFAASLGVRVVAIERGRIGGDCLWTGCVPSKALVASARAVAALEAARALGVHPAGASVDPVAVWDRIRRIQRDIAAAEDNRDALEGAGVRIVEGEAVLVGPGAVRVADRTLVSGAVIVATGSRPAVPDIAGLRDAGFLTSDTLWSRAAPPASVAVVGAGAVGCELGQALARLGSRVILIEALPTILGGEEPRIAAAVHEALVEDGVEVVVEARVTGVGRSGERRVVEVISNSGRRRVEVQEILVAAGRVPNVEGLGLEEIGVSVAPDGIVVDRGMRTSLNGVYAAGDVTGRPRFTHVAAHDATLAVRNILFPGRSRAVAVIPWCVFTDPELAHVGLTTAEAIGRHGARRVRAHHVDLTRSDRGRAEGLTRGEIVLVTNRDRLVGAHVLAPAAGEIIQSLTLAVGRGMRLRDLASVAHVYPTYSWEVQLLAAEDAYRRARRWRRLLRVRG